VGIDQVSYKTGFRNCRVEMSRKRAQTWCLLLMLAVLLYCKVFSVSDLSHSGHLVSHRERPKRVPGSPCDGYPSLLIVVLTYTRDFSLKRLLKSLSLAEYGCAKVDLQVTIDFAQKGDPNALQAQGRCVQVATAHRWEHGCKTVNRRLHHAGLSRSWFESTYSGNQEYVAIFEDDMEVSKHFYSMFRIFAEHGSFSGEDVTGFCLHPNDWDVRVERPCERTLYLSPEPCNWGPIWKRDAWQKYLDWVFTQQDAGSLPFVPEDVAFEYNTFLSDGKDVQSSWLWRYNFDFKQRQVRYSFKLCNTGEREVHLAINHKEPGEHFSSKMNLQNNPDLLIFDIYELLHELSKGRNAFEPYPFSGYKSLSALGANILG